MADIKINPKLSLPSGFHFTQSNLQDFVDCPRRFYLKYMLNQQWPAPTTEPQKEFEQAIQQGVHFHRLAERHQLGIPLSTLQLPDGLSDWLLHYQSHLAQLGPFDQTWPEISFSSLLGNHSLVAKFDLLALKGNAIIAIDWKTGKLSKRQTLQRRLQTSVYLYVLYQEASRFVGQLLSVYTLTYASIATGEIQSFDHDLTNTPTEYLSNLIDTIQDSHFAKTDDERHCHFCTYRSLCERGTTPTASPDEFDSDDWDLTTVSDTEVEF